MKDVHHISTRPYRKIVQNLIDSIEERFAVFFKINYRSQDAILATCFHPDYKPKIIIEYHGKEEESVIRNMYLEALLEHYNNVLVPDGVLLNGILRGKGRYPIKMLKTISDYN